MDMKLVRLQGPSQKEVQVFINKNFENMVAGNHQE